MKWRENIRASLTTKQIIESIINALDKSTIHLMFNAFSFQNFSEGNSLLFLVLKSLALLLLSIGKTQQIALSCLRCESAKDIVERKHD